jgi:UDP-3-O-[3-hydroxymyristoyl] glucosamine N-acyltransferase
VTINPMTLGDLAEQLGAELAAGEGETLAEAAARPVAGVAGIEDCPADRLTFVANPKYAGMARTSHAAAILVEPAFPAVAAATLRIANPYLAWARAIELFHPAPVYAPGVHPTAVVAATAHVGARAHIAAYVVVGEGCQLGDDVVLLPHVVLYAGVTVGDRFFAHAHAVIREGCVLGDDVVLQNACVDRASVGETRIKAGAKIDNLVQVGHGSTVGENTLLCSQVGLAGSTVVGKNVILAGQVGVAGHLTIGDGAIATAQTGIPGDVAPGDVVSGYPAMDNREWLRMVTALKRVPELLKKLRSS